jgi:hypothetical protein
MGTATIVSATINATTFQLALQAHFELFQNLISHTLQGCLGLICTATTIVYMINLTALAGIVLQNSNKITPGVSPERRTHQQNATVTFLFHVTHLAVFRSSTSHCVL